MERRGTAWSGLARLGMAGAERRGNAGNGREWQAMQKSILEFFNISFKSTIHERSHIDGSQRIKVSSNIGT